MVITILYTIILLLVIVQIWQNRKIYNNKKELNSVIDTIDSHADALLFHDAAVNVLVREITPQFKNSRLKNIKRGD
jgi:hypothetical protein